MHIAVNTRLLQAGKLDGIGWFSHEVLSRLVRSMPEHRFTFIFDRPFDKQFIYADNVKGVYRYPPTRHPLLYRVFFDMVIPGALRDMQADLFFSPDGFLSLQTDVPQIPVIHDLNFEHRPHDLPKKYSTYYRRYFPLFAKKAEHILTVSEYSKQDIIQTYGIPAEHIDVAYNSCNEAYRPLNQEERQAAQKRFADGTPYFLFVGNFSYRKNVHGIIRAFDQFRASGKEAKLVLVGNPLWKYEEMEAALIDAEYKDDILMPGRLELTDMVQALGGAEALIFPSYFEGFGIPLVEAMQAGVPVITSNRTSLPEVAGDAALYAEPDDTTGITRHMIEIFSSEDQRIKLIEAGKSQRLLFSWNNTANKVKKVLLDTAIER